MHPDDIFAPTPLGASELRNSATRLSADVCVDASPVSSQRAAPPSCA